jgi:exonuclease III
MIGSPIKIVALNINGGGTRVAPICAYLDAQRADIIVLTEWRDTAQDREISRWAAEKGLHRQLLVDGATANGVFFAAKDPVPATSATPPGGTAGVIMLARTAD